MLHWNQVESHQLLLILLSFSASTNFTLLLRLTSYQIVSHPELFIVDPRATLTFFYLSRVSLLDAFRFHQIFLAFTCQETPPADFYFKFLVTIKPLPCNGSMAGTVSLSLGCSTGATFSLTVFSFHLKIQSQLQHDRNTDLILGCINPSH